MKFNFIGEKPTNVVSIWSWKHPELAMYDPNREDELEDSKCIKNFMEIKIRLIKHSSRTDRKPKGPFVPRII